jgi:hypothetical protein
LDGKEAIEVFKELAIEVKNVPSICITIMPPESDDAFSSGYRIHIPLFGGCLDRVSIQKVADCYQLTCIELADEIIIYKSNRI